MKPQRIQLKRIKGWRMPENTVKVDRSSRWGNPWSIQFCRDWFEMVDRDARQQAIWLYRNWLLGSLAEDWIPKDRTKPNVSELRGKNLACWCKEGDPCHADVLLEIANQ